MMDVVNGAPPRKLVRSQRVSGMQLSEANLLVASTPPITAESLPTAQPIMTTAMYLSCGKVLRPAAMHVARGGAERQMRGSSSADALLRFAAV